MLSNETVDLALIHVPSASSRCHVTVMLLTLVAASAISTSNTLKWTARCRSVYAAGWCTCWGLTPLAVSTNKRTVQALLCS